MSDGNTLVQIIRLKQALERPADASDSEAEEISPYASTNRGNKLKRNSRYVSWTALNVPQPDVDLQLVEFGKDKHAIARKRRHLLFKEDVEGHPLPGESESEEDEIIADIPLRQILQPISDPAQLPTHPGLSRTFESPILSQIAKELLDKIVAARSYLATLGNLLSTFLGDDQSLLHVPTIEANTQGEFFAVPEIRFDRDHGLDGETAEELRQLLQLAYQRLDEYTQCLDRLRDGFTHADRLKRKVLNWCKEMDGQDWVEQEVGLDEYSIQKAALAEQAATDDLQSAASATETA